MITKQGGRSKPPKCGNSTIWHQTQVITFSHLAFDFISIYRREQASSHYEQKLVKNNVSAGLPCLINLYIYLYRCHQFNLSNGRINTRYNCTQVSWDIAREDYHQEGLSYCHLMHWVHLRTVYQNSHLGLCTRTNQG